jgi:hypothetical protein
MIAASVEGRNLNQIAEPPRCFLDAGARTQTPMAEDPQVFTHRRCGHSEGSGASTGASTTHSAGANPTGKRPTTGIPPKRAKPYPFL